MARRRMIDPNFWESDDVQNLEPLARLFLIGMFSHADDYGKGRLNYATLRSKIFPSDDIPLSEIERLVDKISRHAEVQMYQVDGVRYYKFTNWDKWQTVNRPQPSMFPEPPENQCSDDSLNDSLNDSVTDSRLKERKGKEYKGQKVNESVNERFKSFYEAYPKKEKRPDAERAFKKINPDEELLSEILSGVERYKQTEQWQDRKYIPQPASFLNGRRWEDEIVIADRKKQEPNMGDLRGL